MGNPGPEVIEVLSWKYLRAPVYDGTNRPPAQVLGGPERMLVHCAKCEKAPWQVTQGSDVFKEHLFHRQGTGVRIYCSTCQQNRHIQVSDLPGFVEAQ